MEKYRVKKRNGETKKEMYTVFIGIAIAVSFWL